MALIYSGRLVIQRDVQLVDQDTRCRNESRNFSNPETRFDLEAAASGLRDLPGRPVKRTPFATGVTLAALLLPVGFLFWRGRNRMTTAAMPACVENLAGIDTYKLNWSLENRKGPNETPSWDDLRGWFPQRWTNGNPTCPQGGTYVLGRVSEPPRCSIGEPGHKMP